MIGYTIIDEAVIILITTFDEIWVWVTIHFGHTMTKELRESFLLIQGNSDDLIDEFCISLESFYFRILLIFSFPKGSVISTSRPSGRPPNIRTDWLCNDIITWPQEVVLVFACFQY